MNHLNIIFSVIVLFILHSQNVSYFLTSDHRKKRRNVFGYYVCLFVSLNTLVALNTEWILTELSLMNSSFS
jgi:hypothetical protein